MSESYIDISNIHFLDSVKKLCHLDHNDTNKLKLSAPTIASVGPVDLKYYQIMNSAETCILMIRKVKSSSKTDYFLCSEDKETVDIVGNRPHWVQHILNPYDPKKPRTFRDTIFGMYTLKGKDVKFKSYYEHPAKELPTSREWFHVDNLVIDSYRTAVLKKNQLSLYRGVPLDPQNITSNTNLGV